MIAKAVSLRTVLNTSLKINGSLAFTSNVKGLHQFTLLCAQKMMLNPQKRNSADTEDLRFKIISGLNIKRHLNSFCSVILAIQLHSILLIERRKILEFDSNTKKLRCKRRSQ
jgi:hypothetical protein